MTRKVDVLGIGCAAIDRIIHIYGVPPTDGKAVVVGEALNFGGLTATALAAAARLGAKCQFAGRLGSDPDSVAVTRDLRRAGVLVSRETWSQDARPVRSTVIISLDTGMRTIYFTDPTESGAHPAMRDDLVRRARVLFLDGYGFEGSLRAACIARDAGVPIVADFEATTDVRFRELLDLVDHLVLPRSFAQELTGTLDVTAALHELWNDSRKLVAVTSGAAGCWAMVEDMNAIHVPAHRVDVVETLGCGDVFHGAYAAALAFGYSPLDGIGFANSAAGLKAARFGTREGLPNRAEVEALLASSDLEA